MTAKDNIRPFLKWAGNKYRIMQRIRAMLPAGERLVEPFAGSAAVFLNTDYARYLLADSNQDLINLYNIVKTQGADFIASCEKLFKPRSNNEDYFYRRRDEFNRSQNNERKAALFIYLNKHGYNGLCRYNARGGFNVPFGRYKRPYFPGDELWQFHEKAQRAEFVHLDFSQIMSMARSGDVIYCDPPYVPLSGSANFTSYSAGGFDLAQQQQLAELAHRTQQRGIPVLISNHNTDFTRQAYRSATNISRFKVQRSVSCIGSKRQAASELLALYA